MVAAMVIENSCVVFVLCLTFNCSNKTILASTPTNKCSYKKSRLEIISHRWALFPFFYIYFFFVLLRGMKCSKCPGSIASLMAAFHYDVTLSVCALGSTSCDASLESGPDISVSGCTCGSAAKLTPLVSRSCKMLPEIVLRNILITDYQLFWGRFLLFPRTASRTSVPYMHGSNEIISSAVNTEAGLLIRRCFYISNVSALNCTVLPVDGAKSYWLDI